MPSKSKDIKAQNNVEGGAAQTLTSPVKQPRKAAKVKDATVESAQLDSKATKASGSKGTAGKKKAPVRKSSKTSSNLPSQPEIAEVVQESQTTNPASQQTRTQGLLDRYRKEIIPAMRQEFGYKNQMQVPQLRKVVLNMGMGEALTNPKAMDAANADIELITGQKPVIRRAKKSVAAFKVREGMPIGIAVTLRSYRMYDFVERLIHAVLPRVRDFRGVSRLAFDGNGNYSLGIKEQVVFPEIDYNKIDKIRGLQVNIVTTAETDEEAFKLLELIGLPFSREV